MVADLSVEGATNIENADVARVIVDLRVAGMGVARVIADVRVDGG